MKDGFGCPRIPAAGHFLYDQKVTKESSTPVVSNFLQCHLTSVFDGGVFDLIGRRHRVSGFWVFLNADGLIRPVFEPRRRLP
jgi:hypothetical protein